MGNQLNKFSGSTTTQEEWKLTDQFDSAYWSGLDVQIYAGNTQLNEAIQVSYAISEQVRPYYGYSDYTPARMYHGARIIQGEISLNFKRDGFIFSLINQLSNQSANNLSLASQGATVTDTTGSNARSVVTTPVDFTNAAWGPAGANLISQIQSGQIPGNTLSNMAANYTASSTTAYSPKGQYKPNIQENKGIFETHIRGFDLSVIFGANLNSAQTLTFQDGSTYKSTTSTPTPAAAPQNNPGVPTGGGIKLIGVELAGLARTINDDGRPLIETYSFTARDVVILTIASPNTPTNGTNSTAQSSLTTSNVQGNGVSPTLQSPVGDTTNIFNPITGFNFGN